MLRSALAKPERVSKHARHRCSENSCPAAALNPSYELRLRRFYVSAGFLRVKVAEREILARDGAEEIVFEDRVLQVLGVLWLVTFVLGVHA